MQVSPANKSAPIWLESSIRTSLPPPPDARLSIFCLHPEASYARHEGKRRRNGEASHLCMKEWQERRRGARSPAWTVRLDCMTKMNTGSSHRDGQTQLLATNTHTARKGRQTHTQGRKFDFQDCLWLVYHSIISMTKRKGRVNTGCKSD